MLNGCKGGKSNTYFGVNLECLLESILLFYDFTKKFLVYNLNGLLVVN